MVVDAEEAMSGLYGRIEVPGGFEPRIGDRWSLVELRQLEYADRSSYFDVVVRRVPIGIVSTWIVDRIHRFDGELAYARKTKAGWM